MREFEAVFESTGALHVRPGEARISSANRCASAAGEIIPAPPRKEVNMDIALPTLIVALTVAGVAFTTPVYAKEGHTIVPARDIKWGPAPASLPPGAEAAVLFGDPGKEGLFVLRLKFPAGYSVAPHTHPVYEVVTVLSGTFYKGMGETADRRNARALPAGSFFALPPDTAHYVFMDEETVIQISTNGPWGITYINPKDDPRQKTQ
jgi:quercetin dioxygenase-like cupin family protein